MSEDSYTAAAREAYAVHRVSVPVIETLEIYHPSLPERIYLAANTEPITATLETGQTVTFLASSIRVTLPPKNNEGIQDLQIDVCNADRRISDFLETASNYHEKVTCNYRPYVASDLTQPAMNPPLSLVLSEATAQGGQVSATASFADLANRQFPAGDYNRTNHPNLAGF